MIEKTAEERGRDWLGRVGLRPTRQRLALAALLVGDGADRHVTAESLFAAAEGVGEPVSGDRLQYAARLLRCGPDERDHRRWKPKLLRYAA